VPNDAFKLLESLIEQYGSGKFDAAIIKDESGSYTSAAIWLYQNDYLWLNSFVPFARVMQNGIYAYHDEALRRKDELEQQKQEEARKDAERASDRAYADENTQKHFRHDWRINIFNVTAGFVLGIVADHLFDIVGNAVRLGRSFLKWFQSLLPP